MMDHVATDQYNSVLAITTKRAGDILDRLNALSLVVARPDGHRDPRYLADLIVEATGRPGDVRGLELQPGQTEALRYLLNPPTR